MKLEWEQPPASAFTRRPRSSYLDVAEALKHNPGHWAKFPLAPGKDGRTEQAAQRVASYIRTGKMKGFTKGDFEVVSEGGEIWVRYVGVEDLREDAAAFNRRVRDWANTNGMTVSSRGALSKDLVEAYVRATGDKRPGTP